MSFEEKVDGEGTKLTYNTATRERTVYEHWGIRILSFFLCCCVHVFSCRE